MIQMAACRALCKLLCHCCALPLSMGKVKSGWMLKPSLPCHLHWMGGMWSSGDGGGVVLPSRRLSSAWWLGAFSLCDSPLSQHPGDQQRQHVGHKHSPPPWCPWQGLAAEYEVSTHILLKLQIHHHSGGVAQTAPGHHALPFWPAQSPSELWCLAVYGQSDLIVPQLGTVSTDKTNTPD